MADRFTLDFENKEVRVWFYIMVPITIIGISILFFAEYKYQWVVSLLVLSGWLIYYVWRFQFRKNKKKETGYS